LFAVLVCPGAAQVWDTTQAFECSHISRRLGAHGNPAWHILSSIVIKFVTTAVVLALPLPSGSVAPAFVLGALLGRGFGALASPICDWHSDLCSPELKEEFLPRFALIGASAFVAGSMQSFAQVIVVFERTCLPEMLLPLCASALVASFTAQKICKNFFDSVIAMKKLPFLPSLAQGREAYIVEQIMRTEFPVIPLSGGPAAILQARHRFPEWTCEVPIVDVPESSSPFVVAPDTVQAQDRMVVMMALPTMFLEQGDSMDEAEGTGAAAGAGAGAAIASGSSLGGTHLSSLATTSISLSTQLAPPPAVTQAGQASTQPRLTCAEKAALLFKDARSPVLVSRHAPLKALLPMLTTLERTAAFVTESGYLVGAVTMADVYSFACGQNIVEACGPLDLHQEGMGPRTSTSSSPQPRIFRDSVSTRSSRALSGQVVMEGLPEHWENA